MGCIHSNCDQENGKEVLLKEFESMKKQMTFFKKKLSKIENHILFQKRNDFSLKCLVVIGTLLVLCAIGVLRQSATPIEIFFNGQIVHAKRIEVNVLDNNSILIQFDPKSKSNSSDVKTTPPLTELDDKTNKTTTSTDNSDVKITATTPPSNNSDVKITTTTPPSNNSDVKITTTTPLSNNSDVKISTTTPPSNNSNVKIAATTPLSNNSDVKIAITTPPSNNSDVKIAATTPLSNNSDVKIAATTPLSNNSDVKIATTTPPSNNSDVKIAATTPPSNSSDANFNSAVVPKTKTNILDVGDNSPWYRDKDQYYVIHFFGKRSPHFKDFNSWFIDTAAELKDIKGLRFVERNCEDFPDRCLYAIPSVQIWYKGKYVTSDFREQSGHKSLTAWVKECLAFDGAKIKGLEYI